MRKRSPPPQFPFVLRHQLSWMQGLGEQTLTARAYYEKAILAVTHSLCTGLWPEPSRPPEARSTGTTKQLFSSVSAIPVKPCIRVTPGILGRLGRTRTEGGNEEIPPRSPVDKNNKKSQVASGVLPVGLPGFWFLCV